jgi:hypothetical protein
MTRDLERVLRVELHHVVVQSQVQQQRLLLTYINRFDGHEHRERGDD